jgi:hypothetical protein
MGLRREKKTKTRTIVDWGGGGRNYVKKAIKTKNNPGEGSGFPFFVLLLGGLKGLLLMNEKQEYQKQESKK